MFKPIHQLGFGLLSCLGVILFLLFVWALSLVSLIWSYASQHDPYPADAAIVLGAAVYKEVPTPVFAARIDHAITLYKSGQVRKILLTGGVGAGDILAESQTARHYCLARGIPDSAIALETRSHSTHENLLYLQPVIQAQHLERLLIVTDPLHSLRSVSIGRDLGLNAYPAPTPSTRYISWASKGPFLLRELWFYGRYTVGW